MAETLEDIVIQCTSNGLTVSLSPYSSSSVNVWWLPNSAGAAKNVGMNRLNDNNPADHIFFTIPLSPDPYRDNGLKCNNRYTYTLSLLDSHGHTIPGCGPSSCTVTVLACSTNSSTYMALLVDDITPPDTELQTANGNSVPQGRAGSYAWLVPQKTMIFLFTHAKGSISKEAWNLAHKLELLPNYAVQDTSLSIIQSSLTRLEAIARITPLKDGGNDLLVAYEFDQKLTWTGPLVVRANNGPIDHVTGSQALIESDRDFFELLVPRGALIDHYVHNIETIMDGDWALVARLPLPAGGTNAPAVSLAQGSSGVLVAIASVTAQSEGSDFLVGYQLDQKEWLGPVKLIADDGPILGVTGSQDIIVNNEGDIELLVPRGAFIYHYRHAGETILEGNWKSIARLSQPKGNDKAQPISVSLTQNVLGLLELVARVRPPAGTGGDFFVGYEYSQQTGWSTPSVLASDHGPITAGDSSTPPDDDDKDGKDNGRKTKKG
ncbi:MAG TPA: hypothetical protein VKR83_14030 [Ktedonobacteraceae bacterium]|nr:hypothetical protein [Ktedonobacteraceae bacterium]